jgi:hypothetical protein
MKTFQIFKFYLRLCCLTYLTFLNRKLQVEQDARGSDEPFLRSLLHHNDKEIDDN